MSDLRTFNTGTVFEFSPDFPSHIAWQKPSPSIVDRYINHFGGNAIVVSYRSGGEFRNLFIARTYRAVDKWLEKNEFIGSNRGAFRQYCQPDYTLFWQGKEALFTSGMSQDDYGAYLAAEQAFKAMVKAALA